VLVLVVSKSGGTLETLANFFVVRKFLGRNWSRQTVFLTDAKKGFLRELAQKLTPHFSEGKEVRAFAIPENVGGRFSIFSPVGLLPAALAGANLRKLLDGARKSDPRKALEFAQIHAAEFRRGKNISVFCVYSNALESLAKWFEQLLAESLGKNSRVGITPAPAVGAIDQHSKLQLWASGPADKFYIFVGTRNCGKDFAIPTPPAGFEFLRGKKIGDILRAEFLATTESLEEKKRPLAIFDFAEIGEVELGEFLQFWMFEIYFLAKILGVNFADQPGVERGKILARKKLGAN
jgi:glucose-6-phosphate isomerase